MAVEAEKPRCELVEILLASGLPVDSLDGAARTALHCACELGHTAVVKQLLDAGADALAVDRDGLGCSFYAEEHPDILELMSASTCGSSEGPAAVKSVLNQAALSVIDGVPSNGNMPTDTYDRASGEEK